MKRGVCISEERSEQSARRLGGPGGPGVGSASIRRSVDIIGAIFRRDLQADLRRGSVAISSLPEDSLPAWHLHGARMNEDIKIQLARYAALIEQRWRNLSDGERLRLMTLCCRACGAIAKRYAADQTPPCACPKPFDTALTTPPWRCPRCQLLYGAGSDSAVAHCQRGLQHCIACTESQR